MKNIKSFLNFFFRPNKSGLITILLLLFNVITIAQESIPEEFVLGAAFSGKLERRTEPMYYDTFSTSGMNSLIQWAVNGANGNKDLMAGYNVFAVNQDEFEWPGYYANCYYTKWQAEQNQTDPLRVGVKHAGGTSAWWNDTLCWSSGIFVESPDELLIYGPHYRQDNRYKSWAHGDRYNVRYQVRYRMALDNPLNEDPNRPVCNIKVIYKYRKYESEEDWGDSICVFRERTLRVSDFPQGGHFQYFYFDPDYYKYPPQFQLPDYANKIDPSITQYPLYEDSRSYQGIQFVVDWLIDNPEESGLTLYVDHLEVFDEHWGNDFMISDTIAAQTVQKIQVYAAGFSDWSNLKYFLGMDEPWSIDAFTPLRIVDSLLYNNPYYQHKHHLLTVFNPYWSWDNKINGDTLLSQFVRMANPEQLIIDMYPFAEWFPIARFEDFDYLRYTFQQCYTLQPGFWYMGQGFGEQTLPDLSWWIWRYPTNEEFKASMMLALAHGAKGLLPWIYDSYTYWAYNQNPPVLHHIKGLREEDANITATPIWNLLKNNLVPRLKGTLGKKLMDLDYTGNFIHIWYFIPTDDPLPPPTTYDYLTLGYGGMPAEDMHWQCGFFIDSTYIDSKYFFLTNLLTTLDNRTVRVRVTPPVQGYQNYRFRNVEGVFDTTFRTEIVYDLNHTKGEGYLYQVAPVVLYGGRLIYPESVGEGQTLTDDMVIENGATLTIYGEYNANANIIVKNGRIINGENGRIRFAAEKRLIIEGGCTISGTLDSKLALEFTESQNENIDGITINAGGSLVINYCTVENADIGIQSLLNANTINVQYVDFINCSDFAVNIAGITPGQLVTPPPPQIMYCTITNSEKGIWATNLSQIVIRENDIIGSDLGIYLANVATPAVIGNLLIGSSTLSGIFLESCNGVVRGNYISGHTNGLHIGNAHPDLGGNYIEHNWNRGLYVGTGSLPNMRGRLVQDPINPNLWYAVSGYNKINENGGWEMEDDGSEIFINDANAILGRDGCNQITDQRIPNTEDTPPLYNTQLLMNCSSFGHYIEVHAEGNFWDEHPLYRLSERFGSCIVYYEPVIDQPCPLPDGEEGKLFITSSSGEIIDTLYAEERTIGTLSETEQLYASAEEKFLTANYDDAEFIYNQIVSGDDSLSVKLDAYRRLYEIGKLTGKDENYFTGLRESFLSFAGSTNDSLLAKIFVQLSTLSLVANQEYVPAINEFDGIIQQNPNTEEAVYAEIDALTAALLVEGNDSTMQKGSLGKYLLKSPGDYNSKLDGLLRKHFGNNGKETEEEILPTEYTLYQNFPNPFNPTTTIKYDLPNTSDVSLIIYDILGRKVKELVNTKQQAGRYEIQFNAATLASGVYIYQLIAEKYISSKKMILLK